MIKKNQNSSRWSHFVNFITTVMKLFFSYEMSTHSPLIFHHKLQRSKIFHFRRTTLVIQKGHLELARPPGPKIIP